MGQFAFAKAASFGTQTAYGTINATTRDLTGSLATADGVVLGAAGNGVGDSGITYDQERIETPLADITGSFTKQFPSFRRIEPSLTIAVPFAGPRNTASTPPVDADMSLLTNWPGMNALLRSAGLVGAAWGGGVGFQFLPADAIPLTAKIWVGGATTNAFASSYVLQDCFSDLAISFTPGEGAVATFTIGGTRAQRNAGVTLPTFTYGVQASVSPPVVAGVAFAYGMTRGFNELTISISNLLETIGDANIPITGTTIRQNGRTIGLSGTLFADDSDQDYEDTRLETTVANTDDATFTVGTAATNGSSVNAYYIALNNLDVTKLSPVKLGASLARQIDAVCTGPTLNSEFELRFI